MKFPRNIQSLLLQEKVCAFREFQKNAQILEGAVIEPLYRLCKINNRIFNL